MVTAGRHDTKFDWYTIFFRAGVSVAQSEHHFLGVLKPRFDSRGICKKLPQHFSFSLGLRSGSAQQRCHVVETRHFNTQFIVNIYI
jgi:hypothetical protein